MNTYRSFNTIQAVQYAGEFIPEVMCSGKDADLAANGCDPTRKQFPHVHTKDVGGLKVLRPGDWIFPVPGGPFGVADDGKFRSYWEVPIEMADSTVPAAATTAQPGESPKPATTRKARAATVTEPDTKDE